MRCNYSSGVVFSRILILVPVYIDVINAIIYSAMDREVQLHSSVVFSRILKYVPVYIDVIDAIIYSDMGREMQLRSGVVSQQDLDICACVY